MWLNMKLKDSKGNVIWLDGVIDSTGKLTRTVNTKVYEQVVLAKDYEYFTLPMTKTTTDKRGRTTTTTQYYSILDANKDGTVDHYEKEFHFVLMNYIEKDNRIPPKGFNRQAYFADGDFIVPFDAKDTDYPSGQNWDETTYNIPLPSKGSDFTVSAELKYQTFNKEYIDFLDEMDKEKTEDFGGRARNVPCNEGSFYCGYQTWGDVLKQVWLYGGKGEPVLVATASRSFRR